MTTNSDFLAKILLVGQTGVGKTSMLLRYCQTCFCCRNDPPTIGLDFKMKTIEVDRKKIKLQIWDTHGPQRFRNLNKVYYKGAMGIILCYAINNRESFEKIGFLMEEIKEFASKDICIVLVGTKSDLSDERFVSNDEGKKLAESYGIKFFENSAKNAVNIDELFLTLAKDIIRVFGDDASEKLQLGKANSEADNQTSKCF